MRRERRSAFFVKNSRAGLPEIVILGPFGRKSRISVANRKIRSQIMNIGRKSKNSVANHEYRSQIEKFGRKSRISVANQKSRMQIAKVARKSITNVYLHKRSETIGE